MAESILSRRVRFRNGEQKRFLCNCAARIGFNYNEMACFLGISRRTLSDWKRGKFLLPLRVARKLCKQSGHPFPKHAIIEPQFWYTKKAAKIGGTAVLKKYGVVGGNSDERRKQWQRWWDTKGKYQRHSILERQSFRKPRITGHLAEFFGIMLGDGGMSKFQFRITLHHKDDLEFSKYVVRLIQSLFGIRPSIYHRVKMSVNDIAVSRIGLVEYLSSLGLPIGNKTKQSFNIPTWIMERDSLSRACVRGLVDTDGCVVIHKYRVSGKCYVYKKLEFTSASCPLVVSVKKIMEKNGLHPRMTRSGKGIYLDRKSDVAQYIRVFGSHNPKHLIRYKQ